MGGKRTDAGAGVTSGNGNAASGTNAEHGIQRGERVIEERTLIEDTRLSAHVDKVFSQQPCEKLVHFSILGEEAVGADIESAAGEGDRSGKSADDWQALEHGDGCGMTDSFMCR